MMDELNDQTEHAPSCPVPARRLGALEHPMIIKNVDKAMNTFPAHYSLEAVGYISLLYHVEA